MGVNKDRGRYLLPGCDTVKRRCNICLRNVDHLRTDKWEKNSGFVCVICYDCQTVIQTITETG